MWPFPTGPRRTRLGQSGLRWDKEKLRECWRPPNTENKTRQQTGRGRGLRSGRSPWHSSRHASGRCAGGDFSSLGTQLRDTCFPGSSPHCGEGPGSSDAQGPARPVLPRHSPPWSPEGGPPVQLGVRFLSFLAQCGYSPQTPHSGDLSPSRLHPHSLGSAWVTRAQAESDLVCLHEVSPGGGLPGGHRPQAPRLAGTGLTCPEPDADICPQSPQLLCASNSPPHSRPCPLPGEDKQL